MMTKYLDDLLILAGCILVALGVYQIYPPAAWIVGGAELIGLGVLTGLGGNNAHT